jgi:hypothetical protein
MENREWIAKQIHLKNMYAYPYQSLGNDVKHVVTDVDHFPYTRFYRGVFDDTQPHLWEREAGYHPLQNKQYKDHVVYVKTHEATPHTQVACSTIFPRKHCDKSSPCHSQSCIVSPP